MHEPVSARLWKVTIAMNSYFPIRNVTGRHGQVWRVAGLALAVMCSNGPHAAMSDQTWRIDEAHTSIGFKIGATGFPTMRGRFTRYRGQILINFDRPARSRTRRCFLSEGYNKTFRIRHGLWQAPDQRHP